MPRRCNPERLLNFVRIQRSQFRLDQPAGLLDGSTKQTRLTVLSLSSKRVKVKMPGDKALNIDHGDYAINRIQKPEGQVQSGSMAARESRLGLS